MENMVYVVEDNDDIRELIEYIFEDENFSVMSFSTATAFKKQCEISFPNLILLDIMLPDGNGITICNELKAADSTSHIPILLMSANANISVLGKESKADDFISKPFDIDELMSRVKKLLKA